jgi:hypothetical protein
VARGADHSTFSAASSPKPFGTSVCRDFFQTHHSTGDLAHGETFDPEKFNVAYGASLLP